MVRRGVRTGDDREVRPVEVVEHERRRAASEEVAKRLAFHNTGPTQNANVMVGQLNGQGLPGANFEEIVVLINADAKAQTVTVPELAGRRYAPHPVHRTTGAADARAANTTYTPASGAFSVPARTAVVFVAE